MQDGRQPAAIMDGTLGLASQVLTLVKPRSMLCDEQSNIALGLLPSFETGDRGLPKYGNKDLS